MGSALGSEVFPQNGRGPGVGALNPSGMWAGPAPIQEGDHPSPHQAAADSCHYPTLLEPEPSIPAACSEAFGVPGCLCPAPTPETPSGIHTSVLTPPQPFLALVVKDYCLSYLAKEAEVGGFEFKASLGNLDLPSQTQT